MKLHNTLSRKIEDFKPLEVKAVKLYTCGPTVYNYYHVGNLRNAVFNDTLRRTLEALDYEVHHVMNITDVGHLVSDADAGEDKLEKGAKREGKSVWDVAEHYTEAFKNDMSAMNILPPNAYQSQKYGDSYARATEFIDAQIDIIKLLLDRGYAYQASRAIYFDVTKLEDYGALSGQKLKDKETAVRGEVISDDEKRGPHDFALWFFTVGRYSDHEMRWQSPWGEGFPGWHLECSAIIHAVLDDPIDIHTGGIDHIGTHHPNEMAQTMGAFGHSLSNYWVHNEFVLVDGKKMSKSLGNTFTLQDITERGYDPLSYRLLCLQAHYRSELNFTWDSLEAAQTRLKAYQAMADQLWQPIDFSSAQSEQLDSAKNDITEMLSNDLNTPSLLASLNLIEEVVNSNGLSQAAQKSFGSFLVWLDQVLGLKLSEREDITAEQKTLIADRERARKAKDWAKSDELRAKLEGQDIAVRDTTHGPIWSRL